MTGQLHTPTGTLILAGTPLGNPGDASARLRTALATSDLVAAEDTRKFARLLSDLQVHRELPVVSYYEGVEAARWPRLAAVLDAGGTVLLVTDAGMPAVSDPGFRAVQAAISSGHDVQVLPGPSAVTAALALSGLPSDRFCFEGFLPRRAGELESRLSGLAHEARTQVYFESPRRLPATLAAMTDRYGSGRRAVVCRELTKTYQEVIRGDLSQLAAWAAATEVRGEITIVVAGSPPPTPTTDPAELARRVRELEAAGSSRKEALAEVAQDAGVPRRAVFDAVVAAKAAGTP